MWGPLYYINYVDLQSNLLSGSLPSSLMNAPLISLNLQFNALSGIYQDSWVSQTMQSCVIDPGAICTGKNYNGICGPLNICSQNDCKILSKAWTSMQGALQAAPQLDCCSDSSLTCSGSPLRIVAVNWTSKALSGNIASFAGISQLTELFFGF